MASNLAPSSGEIGPDFFHFVSGELVFDDCERQRRARKQTSALAICKLQPATMGLDDGARDREPEAKSLIGVRRWIFTASLERL